VSWFAFSLQTQGVIPVNNGGVSRIGRKKSRFDPKKDRLLLQRDHSVKDVGFKISSLKSSTVPDLLPDPAWWQALDPVIMMANRHDWQKIEIPVDENSLPLVDDELSRDPVFFRPEVRTAVKSIVRHLHCLALFRSKKDAINNLTAQIVVRETEIARLEQQLSALRDIVDWFQRQMDVAVLEAAELSPGLERVLKLPGYAERDRASEPRPRGHHRRKPLKP
jgi:hypothetical protein